MTEITSPKSGLILSQTITTTLSVSNTGQTDAGAATFSLYDGTPADRGVLIGELSPTMPAESAARLEISWQSDTLGEHRLFAVSDSGDAVGESNEGNNQTWQDVYVGFAGPLRLNSGTATDPAYQSANGYGFIDQGQSDIISTCTISTTATPTRVAATTRNTPTPARACFQRTYRFTFALLWIKTSEILQVRASIQPSLDRQFCPSAHSW